MGLSLAPRPREQRAQFRTLFAEAGLRGPRQRGVRGRAPLCRVGRRLRVRLEVQAGVTRSVGHTHITSGAVRRLRPRSSVATTLSPATWGPCSSLPGRGPATRGCRPGSARGPGGQGRRGGHPAGWGAPPPAAPAPGGRDPAGPQPRASTRAPSAGRAPPPPGTGRPGLTEEPSQRMHFKKLKRNSSREESAGKDRQEGEVRSGVGEMKESARLHLIKSLKATNRKQTY